MSSSRESFGHAMEVRLLPQESFWLLNSLESMASGVNRDFESPKLASIVDQLGDSSAVASWLHEYVRLEVRPDEVAELRDAVAAASKFDSTEPRDKCIALSHISEKLATLA